MLLNRNEALMLTLILRGTPAAVEPRVSREGALAGGKIVARSRTAGLAADRR